MGSLYGVSSRALTDDEKCNEQIIEQMEAFESHKKGSLGPSATVDDLSDEFKAEKLDQDDLQRTNTLLPIEDNTDGILKSIALRCFKRGRIDITDAISRFSSSPRECHLLLVR